jgi:hypothetical protein
MLLLGTIEASPGVIHVISVHFSVSHHQKVWEYTMLLDHGWGRKAVTTLLFTAVLLIIPSLWMFQWSHQYISAMHGDSIYHFILPQRSKTNKNLPPQLEAIRKRSLYHQTSAVVSQWSGRGPAIFTRRLRPGRRRRLLWKDVADWTEARSAAVDSITNYFGSFTWGSIGWCYKTRFFNESVGECVPEFAAQGQSPWLNKGGYRNDICPG